MGYALTLVPLFDTRLALKTGEHREDVVVGCVSVAMQRAALFGRAPVVYDLELAFTLFGFLGEAQADLAGWRAGVFAGVAHDYHRRRALADRVPPETLRMSPADVRTRLSSWRELIRAD
jgi:hypothetical protein